MLLNLQRIRNKTENKTENKTDGLFDGNGTVFFGLQKNDSVVVMLDTPNVINNTPEEIASISESYANFLLHINHGLIYDKMIGLLNTRLKEFDDDNNQLFINNVLYFLPILENELQNAIEKQNRHRGPLIRPINVFSHTLKS